MDTPSRYFGGDGSSLGRVRLLAPTSFTAFVKEVLGHPAIVNVTRAQYAAMDKKERTSVKRVPYFTPAAFRNDPSDRVYEEATTCGLIALDIDNPEQAAPFYRRPQLLADALQPLAFACYTTASSTPNQPRIRIVVAAHDIAVADYSKAVQTVAARLGLQSITKESKVAVQPMYLPTLFRDDDPLEAHPLLIAVVTGEALLPGQLGDASVPTERAPGKAPHQPIADGDDLEFLRATVDAVSLGDVQGALEHLDPDCGYQEWLEVAAALRHQFPHTPNEAYTLFDQWSSKGKKYTGPEDTEAKWKSLRPTPRGRVPITVRTLFHRAQEAGWSPNAVATRLYQSVLAWLSDPSRTQHELMADGLRRIAGLPLQSPIERGTLLARLRDALAVHKLKVTLTDMKRELHAMERAARNAVPQAHKSTPDNQLPPWARGICYVSGTNEFYQRSTDRKFSPEVVDRMYGVFLMEGESESGRPSIRPQDYLLNLAKIPRVDNYWYDPTHPEQTFVQSGKHKFVNLYIPTYPEPDAKDADAAGAILWEHLENLIAEDEYRQILMDFMAYNVQQPGGKIRWAVLLQGAQGCGKTALAELMRSVLGQNNVTVMDASLLFTQFNTWAAGSQIVAMEEIRVIGHNRHEVMNKLKPCISNDTVTINGKNKDLRINVPNNTNYIMFTNHHDSLAVSDGDRRYFVLNSALQNKSQVLALGPTYFVRLFEAIRDRAPGMRAFLEQWRISPGFNPNGHAPATTYLKELTYAAATPLSAALVEAIGDAEHPLVRGDLISTKALKAILELDRSVRFTDQQMGVALRELDFINTGRFRLPDGRQNIWVKRGTNFPDPLAEANKRLKDTPPNVEGLEHELL